MIIVFDFLFPLLWAGMKTDFVVFAYPESRNWEKSQEWALRWPVSNKEFK